MQAYDGLPLQVAWRVVERRGVDLSDLFGIATSVPLRAGQGPLRACCARIRSSAARRRRHGKIRQYQPQEGSECLSNKAPGRRRVTHRSPHRRLSPARRLPALQLASDVPISGLDEIRRRLRGRGGAGTTAEKLALVGRAPTTQYIVCNAYDADPRSLIASRCWRRAPAVLEGIRWPPMRGRKRGVSLHALEEPGGSWGRARRCTTQRRCRDCSMPSR